MVLFKFLIENFVDGVYVLEIEIFEFFLKIFKMTIKVLFGVLYVIDYEKV